MLIQYYNTMKNAIDNIVYSESERWFRFLLSPYSDLPED